MNSTATAPSSAMMKPARLIGRIHAERSSDETAEQRADDAEHHRDDDAARITTRHQQLGNRADDQTEDDPSKNAHLIPHYEGH